MHAATSKVENSAQGLSCQLKFVHDPLLKSAINQVTLHSVMLETQA
jgi:hypothetical protein